MNYEEVVVVEIWWGYEQRQLDDVFSYQEYLRAHDECPVKA